MSSLSLAKLVALLSIFALSVFIAHSFVLNTFTEITTWYNILISGSISTAYCFLVIIARHICSNFLSKTYYIASLWLGFMFYLFTSSIICVLLGIPLFAFLPTSALFLYGTTNALSLKVRKIQIKVPTLSQNYRIAHLSDLHLGAIYRKDWVCKITQVLQKLKPDLIAITGDLFDGSMEIGYDDISALDGENVVYVFGNHEDFAGIDHVLNVVRKSKIKLLRNEMMQFSELNIIGVEYAGGKSHLFRELRKLGPQKNKINILLYHSPCAKAEELEEFGVNIHLAGHTHGGQIFPMNNNRLDAVSLLQRVA